MIKRLLVFKVDGFCVVDSLGGCIEQKPQTSEVESPRYLNKKCVNVYVYVQHCCHGQEQYWERAVLDIDPSAILLPGNLGEIRWKDVVRN